MLPGLKPVPRIRPAPYVPASPHDAFNHVTYSPLNSSGGYAGYTLRQKIPLVGTGKEIRISAYTPLVRVANVWVAEQSSDYNTKRTPFSAMSLYNGGDFTFTVQQSGWIGDGRNFWNLSGSESLIVIFNVSGGAISVGPDVIATTTLSGLTMWYRNFFSSGGGTFGSDPEANPPGTWNSHSNFLAMVTKVEMR